MQISSRTPDYCIINSALGLLNTPGDSDTLNSVRTTELTNSVPLTHCFVAPLYPILSSCILHGSVSELSTVSHSFIRLFLYKYHTGFLTVFYYRVVESDYVIW